MTTRRRGTHSGAASKSESQLGRNAYPWLPEHNTPPLSPILYSAAVVKAADPHVQAAVTRSEMITRSGLPEEVWLGPKKTPRSDVVDVTDEAYPPHRRKVAPKLVDAAEAKTFVDRILAVRNAGGSRGRIGELAGLGTGGKIWRIERGKLYVDEVSQLDSALRQLELELKLVPVS